MNFQLRMFGTLTISRPPGAMRAESRETVVQGSARCSSTSRHRTRSRLPGAIVSSSGSAWTSPTQTGVADAPGRLGALRHVLDPGGPGDLPLGLHERRSFAPSPQPTSSMRETRAGRCGAIFAARWWRSSGDPSASRPAPTGGSRRFIAITDRSSQSRAQPPASRLSQASAWATMASRSAWRGVQASRSRIARDVGDERRRIAGPARGVLDGEIDAGHALDGLQHLTDRDAAPVAAIERQALAAAAQMAQGRDVGVGEIADLDVVAHAKCRPGVALSPPIDRHPRRRPDRRLAGDLEWVRMRRVGGRLPHPPRPGTAPATLK